MNDPKRRFTSLRTLLLNITALKPDLTPFKQNSFLVLTDS